MNAPMEIGKWYLFAKRGEIARHFGQCKAIGAGHVYIEAFFAAAISGLFYCEDIVPLFEIPTPRMDETESAYLPRMLREAKPVVAPEMRRIT